jgi:uncharacterized OB-fold protein
VEQRNRNDVAQADRVLPAPYSNRDYDFFYKGLAARQLLVQKCDGCGELRNPPGPMCPRCRSLRWSALKCAGTGEVYSYTTHRHPPLPSFETPHTIVLAQMSEGFRLIAGLQGNGAEGVQIGMPVSVEFEQRGEVPTFHFVPA